MRGLDDHRCGSQTCCGAQCCGQGELCCQLEQGVWITQCYTLKSGETTCPVGCPQCVSDRNLKRDIEPVDAQAVLEHVARMPVSTWSYKTDDPSLRHMGPMAQDFKAAFDLGDTDKAYNPIDAHGVTFAAIQALYERVQAQDARIERLERENASLRARPR
ncbi:MAG TPA: tail fiber domain-containing protein [Polyangiaceae bacterium]